MRKPTDQTILANDFNNAIGSIDLKRPILLFPVRLETHYRDTEKTMPATGSQPERTVSTADLCVRIFPDEILLNYYKEGLRPQEISDGKNFWIQWFIASGSDAREFDAWRVLCAKYDVDKASWIARSLYPKSMYEFMDRRPYLRINRVEEAITKTYSLLGDTLLDEDLTHKTVQERKLEENLQQLDDHLSAIVNCVRNAEYIVDYLYDAIVAVIDYLQKRLVLFVDFYMKCESQFVGDLQAMELWDTDYNELVGMEKRVSSIAKEFEGRRIPMDQMVKMYLDDPKNKDVFPVVEVDRADYPSAVKANLLPERFLLYAETKDKRQYVKYGNAVNPDLDLGLVPSKDISEEFAMDKDSNLMGKGKISWMTDYDEAESSGMAITLTDVGSSEFSYIYVIGIQSADSSASGSATSTKLLEELFLGHNYFGEGMNFVRKGTPTNQVEGAAPVEDLSEEEIMRLRYEIEVKKSTDFRTSSSFVTSRHEDNRCVGSVIADAFCLPKDDLFYRVPGYESQEMNESTRAMSLLWDSFVAKRVKESSDSSFKTYIDRVGTFFKSYVRAAGPYPTLRIGNNPYGVLPVTDYMAMLESMAGTDTFDSYIPPLFYHISKLGAQWQQLRDRYVNTVTGGVANSPERHFLRIASQNARSVAYRQRALVKSPLLQGTKADSGGLLGINDYEGYYKSEITDVTSEFDLSEMRTVVKVDFPDMSDERADELVGEFIDLMSYRLDAWYTAMVSYVIGARGAGRPAIGAYGWVFNLRRSNRASDPDAKTVIEEMKLPSDSKVVTSLGKVAGEYIMAPSVQHAITAAVLRSSYIGAKGNGQDSRLCINLSSTRARQALRILECIKDGMATSVVLGTEFERYLHDAAKNSGYTIEMDKFIYPLRKLYPQSMDIFSPNDSRAKNYTLNVINAESLLNSIISDKNDIHWNNSGRLSKWLETNFAEVSPLNELLELPEFKADEERVKQTLCSLIERVYDSYDALNDLLLGEGVYRLVAGDKASFAAISNFMAKGSGNVPSPVILDTPLEYVAVAQKVVLPMPSATSRPLSALANAEPRVNQWVKGMIGKMSSIVFWIEGRIGEEVVFFEKSDLESLDIDPIEYLYASSSEHSFLNLLEIKWRKISGHIKESIKIYTGDPSQLAPGEVLDKSDDEFSLYEDSMRIGNLRALIASSRALRASDFAPGQDINDESSTIIEDLKTRLDSTLEYVNRLKSNIQYAYDDTADVEYIDDKTMVEMYSLVATAIECGMHNASLPYRPELMISQYGKTTQRPIWDKCVEVQKEFRNSLKSIVDIIDEKIKQCSQITLSSVESYCEAIKKLTLDSFRVLPLFRLDEVLPAEEKAVLSSALGKSVKQNFKNADYQTIDEWIEETAKVRSGMKVWDDISMFAAASEIELGKPSVYQIKADHTAGSEWLGGSVSAESELNDADTMVILSSSDMKEGAANCGIVVDSWMEYIPYIKHTAGMAIHCDQPDAEAPQAILMAVHPSAPAPSRPTYMQSSNDNAVKKWTVRIFAEILDSTRFMLQNRAVSPEIIYGDSNLSAILPLLSDAQISGYLSGDGGVTSFNHSKNELVAGVEREILREMPGGSLLNKPLK